MRKPGTIIRALAAVCALAALLGGCRQSPAAESQSGGDLPVIRVGCDTYPPYNYTGTDGWPAGIDIDLATEAFRRMGYQPKFVSIDWESKRTLVERGDIDCIWSSFSIDGRESDYRWAGPYMASRQVVAVMRDSSIYTLADLAGKTVAVQATTKPEEIFLAGTDPRIPRLQAVFSMQNRELIYPAMSKGYVDAVAAHETSVLQYMADYGVDYRILEEPLMVVGLGVAFARDDERGLAESLSDTLDGMRADGTTREILARYLPDPDPYLEVDSHED